MCVCVCGTCAWHLTSAFAVGNVLFKFAIDQGVFGGDHSSAAKVAGLELQVRRCGFIFAVVAVSLFLLLFCLLLCSDGDGLIGLFSCFLSWVGVGVGLDLVFVLVRLAVTGCLCWLVACVRGYVSLC